MGKKRKRPVKNGQTCENPLQTSSNSSSCFKTGDSLSPQKAAEYSHPVISLYYSEVVTLRQYLLQQIPASSKSRRRRIASVRNGSASTNSGSQAHNLALFLDTTLVGILKESPPTCTLERRRNLAGFIQSHSTSRITGTDTGPLCAQAEIVNFVISSLFNHSGFSHRRPHHLLTHGFQRICGPELSRKNDELACSIPGLVARFPNKNAQALKQEPWTGVLGLLGCNGDEIMLRLLFDCGIYTAIDHRKGVYYQISGLPLSMLEPVHKGPQPKDLVIKKTVPISPTAMETVSKSDSAKDSAVFRNCPSYKPNSIVFPRRRMLYAPPTLNSKGKIEYGLTNRHVLSRCSPDSMSQSVHLMKYIFPKHFGLHNVFTSTQSSENAQPYKDYSSREVEISRANEQRQSQAQRSGAHSTGTPNESGGFNRIPRRLRRAVDLVQKLQKRHKRCSYAELLRYYCPLDSSGPWKYGVDNSQNERTPGSKSSAPEDFVTQLRVPTHTHTSQTLQEGQQLDTSNVQNPAPQNIISRPKLRLTDHATPAPSVSAFCRAALRKLIPPQWYGTGQQGKANQDIVLRNVDRFVCMRRYENLSIHEICKGIKITSIPWLEPPDVGRQQVLSQNKLSLSDMHKRTEIFHELIYYIFDSILIPLVRSNFYVTESQIHRNRLFFFQHDVWRQLTQQPLADLKSSMFEELKPEKANNILGRRSLGYGSLRLLPKMTGIRPIVNLRRRMQLKSKWTTTGVQYLGPSINSTVAPIFNVLNYEKTRNPAQLGSCLYSVGEIHSRLKAFKEQMSQGSSGHTRQLPFYFVKLDIQSCFDTIPQQKLIHLVEKLVSEEAYHVTKYVEMRVQDEFSNIWPSQGSRQNKGVRKFVGRAAPAMKPQPLAETIESGGVSRRRNTVFVDTVAQKYYNTEDLLDLLNEHLRNNLVKFGKKFFRQRNGIPQGSVLSSLLCNLFYAEMEREKLGFLGCKEALLLRLVDDFLLITSNPTLAMRFLKVMVKGQPAYGITVNPAKSLVNFGAVVEGAHIPRLIDSSLFPYCGSLIDTRTLEVHKDHDRILEGGDSAAENLSNSLTVELARAPGHSFHRKVLASFKLLMHPMYLDTSHNSLPVVLSNLYANFVMTAMRMYRYMRALIGRRHPTPAVVIRVIRDLIQLSHRFVQAKRTPSRQVGEGDDSNSSSTSMVHGFQVQYLAAAAFRHVLGRKQTRYGAVLHWLDQIQRQARPKSNGKLAHLVQVVRKGNMLYGGWRY